MKDYDYKNELEDWLDEHEEDELANFSQLEAPLLLEWAWIKFPRLMKRCVNRYILEANNHASIRFDEICRDDFTKYKESGREDFVYRVGETDR